MTIPCARCGKELPHAVMRLRWLDGGGLRLRPLPIVSQTVAAARKDGAAT